MHPIIRTITTTVSLAATLALASGSALAQAATDFPEGAEPLAPEALSEAVSGKVFIVKPAKGLQWRWQFNANGYAYLNIGRRAITSQWSTKDSSLCQSGGNTGCNEMRRKDNVLYIKRDSGEVVAFQPE